MKKKLVNNFVITSTLIVLGLICFIAIGTRYIDQYWDDYHMHQELEWINGILSEDQLMEKDGFEIAYHGYRPIYGILMNENREIVQTFFLGDELGKNLDADIKESMTHFEPEKWRIRNYVYSWKKTDTGYLLLFTDNRYDFNEDIKQEWLSHLILFMVGMAISVLVSIHLSRFITKPVLDSLEREKRFISDVSHELKTPIGAIGINAQVLERDLPDNRYLQNIRRESERTQRLVRSLLELSRLENQDISPDQTLISLSECVEEIVLGYESIAFEKGISYTYDLMDQLTIKGNADEIQYLIIILIDNAMKYTEYGGTIKITLSEEAKEIQLKVYNSGKEIPADQQELIFDRFYMADSSRNGDSFGLGLAIAKTITTRHGGSIDVKSGAGEGTTFIINFKE